MTGKKVFLRTFGCQMNVRDSEIIAGNLISKGYQLTESAKAADVILINTCSVRKHAEDRVWSEIGRHKKSGPSTSLRTKKPIIGLLGCMAEYYKYDAFKKSEHIDFICGPNNIASIPFLIEQAAKNEAKGMAVGQKQRDEFVYNTNFQTNKNKAFVVIAEGCNNFCSYCVVPLVRGMERSRNYKDILREVSALVAKGINEITLLGQNVNSYKSDSVDFPGLLEMLNEIEDLKIFNFYTSHPKDASKILFKVMANLKKIDKYLHLPIQSGSDRILKLMNRNYTARQFLEKIEDYKKIVNGLLSTDVIVGFPGESEKDFQATKNILESVRFNNAYIFKYSPRPHTGAAKLKDDVSMPEKERRHRILLDLQRKIAKGKKK